MSHAIGVSRWRTSEQFMIDYKNGVQVEENEAMRIGKRDEPKVRNCYARERGVKVRECGPVHHIAYPEWMAVNPDGLVEDDGCIEIKCKQNTYRGVPVEHYCQMQYQMEFTCRSWCDYVVKYNLTNEVYVWRIERDKEFWQFMAKRLMRAYKGKHEFKDKMPEMRVKFTGKFRFE